MDHERILYTFKTNIVAMFDLTRYAIPHMPRGSSIINVGSIQALVEFRSKSMIHLIRKNHLNILDTNHQLKFSIMHQPKRRLLVLPKVSSFINFPCSTNLSRFRSRSENVGKGNSSELCCTRTSVDTLDRF